MLRVPSTMVCVMIRAPLARLGLAALLCSVAPGAFAQQQQPAQQRSRTEPKSKPAEPTQPRGTTGSTQKTGTTSTAQKPGSNSTAQQKPGSGSTAKPGAAGQTKPGPATGPGGAQAALLATFTDWGAYASGQGRAKICYALSQPKDRLPKDLKRDPAYLFVSFRPADNVRNEVAVVMGFAGKDGAPAEAVIGTTTYALVTKGANAWVRNPAEEGQVIGNMSKGKDLVVKATSARGNAATDRYSLSGFAQALDRARKECS
jgi:hypothetical protein